MSNSPVVGSAFVEVHARAASTLEREIQQDVNKATARVQTHRESIGLGPKAEGAFERSQAPEKQAAAAALQERLARSRAAAEETVAKKVKDTGDAAEKANTKAAVSQNAWGTSLARTAAAVAVVDIATRAVVGSITAFLQAGDEGRLKSEEDLRSYRQLSNGLDDLSAAWDRAKLAAGRFIAANVNPASSDFQKGIIALKNPLDTLSVALGRTTDGTRDLARQFAAVDESSPAETVAEVQRRVDALTESAARYAKEFDARTDATIRAVGIEFEQIGANDRLWRAQEKVNEVRARGADVARRMADAERDINEARQAAADAAQNATERDRAVAEARRNLRIVQFEQGAGSQAALDAADAVQEAEFDAVRAHQEAGDAILDVAKAQRKAADERIQANDDLEDAEQALQDAQRQSARTSADLQAAMREASGETVTGTEKLRLYLAELDKFSGTGGKVQAEIDIIKRALETLPSPSGLDAATERMLAELGRVYSQGFAPGFNPNAPPAGFVDPGAPTPITLSPPPVQITNIFNTPVDPAQIAREQAAQIGATPSPQRLFS